MPYHPIDYDEKNVTSNSQNNNNSNSGILFFIIIIIIIYTLSNFYVIIILGIKKWSINKKKVQDINYDNYFLKNPIPPEKELICSICMNNLNNNYVLTKCNHYYHKDCIYEWLNLKMICPNCKSDLNQLENL
tara:strand:+ start:1240 stop:1635 length:396 start_codon:yes stop_codon:yes gene_type:complete